MNAIALVDRYKNGWPNNPRLSHIIAERGEFWLACTETLDRPRIWMVFPKDESRKVAWVQCSSVKIEGTADEFMQHGASIMKLARVAREVYPEYYEELFSIGTRLLDFRSNLDLVDGIFELPA